MPDLITDKPSGLQRFLDPVFAPFRSKKSNPNQSIGVGGSAVYGGYLEQTEENSKLRGRERYLKFSNMLSNISIVAAGTRYYLNLLARAKWKFEPADDSDEAKRLSDLCEDILMETMDTPWHRVVRRGAMYRFHGFSIQEWTARLRDDGVIGYADIEARPQVTIERWDMDATGNVHGVVQRAPQNQREIYLPRNRLFYVVDDTLNDTPEGLGLFRHLTDPAYRLCRFELLEAYGYETDLRGIPVGRAPIAAINQLVENGSLSEVQGNAAVNAMSNFITNHIKSPQLGLLLDSITYRNLDEAASPSTVKQWDMELLKGDSANSSAAVAMAIERLNNEMARVLGVEGLLLGDKGRGSLALSRDKSHNFALLVDGGLTELAEVAESDLITPLFLLNGWDLKLRPKLKTEATRYRDVGEITGALADMAQAGAVLAPNDPAIDEVRDILGVGRQDLTTVEALLDAALSGNTGNEPPPEPAPAPGEQ